MDSTPHCRISPPRWTSTRNWKLSVPWYLHYQKFRNTSQPESTQTSSDPSLLDYLIIYHFILYKHYNKCVSANSRTAGCLDGLYIYLVILDMFNRFDWILKNMMPISIPCLEHRCSFFTNSLPDNCYFLQYSTIIMFTRCTYLFHKHTYSIIIVLII